MKTTRPAKRIARFNPETDISLNLRFKDFRYKNISRRQYEASSLLGCSQSKLSDIEAGRRGIDFEIVVKMVKEFDLNANWLATGEGKENIN